MNDKCSLLTVASWEERFLLGLKRTLETEPVERVVMLYYGEFAERTRGNRDEATTLLNQRGVMCEHIAIAFGDPPGSWHAINKRLRADSERMVIDFTTMPREAFWVAISILRDQARPTSYVYHSPEDYHAKWLSRDPGRPRLVYKLSGLATLGRQTCLVITTGFDPERTRQLMWFYEPRRILLGFQTGQQFQNQQQNVERHRASLMDEYREFEVREFELDAYSPDRGESTLLQEIEQIRDSHNIVMTSLGPKLGAIALFRVHMQFPEIALCYTPSNEFNVDYSKGIAASYSGSFPW